MKQRILYPDICKFLAIFLVTWSHCAQCISGQTWSNFLCGSSIDISFNMPLFMLISGWFINPDKIRNTDTRTYLSAKFKRLVVPAIVWTMIHVIVFTKLPTSLSGTIWLIKSIVNYYWYLTALFACLFIIFLFAKVFTSNKVCIFISTLFVLLCPSSEFANINFMFPFIWAGYGLQRIIEKQNNFYMISLFFISSIILGVLWNPSYTVYISPFVPLHLNLPMIIICIYRFIIGLCFSSVIIFIVKTYENTFIKRLAKLGQYSLVIYTASIAILKFLSLVLVKYDLHNNQSVVLDIISLITCIVVVYVCIIIGNICRKNKWTKILFLGE